MTFHDRVVVHRVVRDYQEVAPKGSAQDACPPSVLSLSRSLYHSLYLSLAHSISLSLSLSLSRSLYHSLSRSLYHCITLSLSRAGHGRKETVRLRLAVDYRGTSLIRNCSPPWDCHRALGMGRPRQRGGISRKSKLFVENINTVHIKHIQTLNKFSVHVKTLKVFYDVANCTRAEPGVSAGR